MEILAYEKFGLYKLSDFIFKNNRFIETNEDRLDLSQRAEYNEQLASLWLNFRLDMIGVSMVTGVALLAVLEHHFGMTNSGLVGLAITYSIR